MSKTDAARWSVDWARVIDNLQKTGLSLSEIANLADCSKSSLFGYIGDGGVRSFPEHSTGERILCLWIERTSCKREDAPRWRRPLSVSEVLKAYK
jgi:DNA-binding transcriptional MerR regulator